jgi:hypothetical protein
MITSNYCVLFFIMDNIQTEKEIQERVEFKINELLTNLRNRLKHKYGQAFDMTRESNEKLKAFQELMEVAEKEIILPCPYDSMTEERKRKAKDKAVEEITKALDMRWQRDYHIKIRRFVSIIEKAQNY